jgi:hypothetical protein
VTLRLPKLFNLRRDPFERADHNSNTYWDWVIDKAAWMYMGTAAMTQFLMTLEEYPPSQRPDSWSIDKLTEQISVNSWKRNDKRGLVAPFFWRQVLAPIRW